MPGENSPQRCLRLKIGRNTEYCLPIDKLRMPDAASFNDFILTYGLGESYGNVIICCYNVTKISDEKLYFIGEWYDCLSTDGNHCCDVALLSNAPEIKFNKRTDEPLIYLCSGTLHPNSQKCIKNAYPELFSNDKRKKISLKSLPNWNPIEIKDAPKYLKNLDDKRTVLYVYELNNRHGNLYILAECSNSRTLLISDAIVEKQRIASTFNREPDQLIVRTNPLRKEFVKRVHASYDDLSSSNPIDKKAGDNSNAKKGGCIKAPGPSSSRKFIILGDKETLAAKLEDIGAQDIDKNDEKSNKKIKIAGQENKVADANTNLSGEIQKDDGDAVKYAKAMKVVAAKINEITTTITKKFTDANTAPNGGNDPGTVNICVDYVESIYCILAKQLQIAGYIINGFNVSSGLLDGKFLNSNMKKNPSKLNIIGFKTKYFELSDTKRYTQDFIGVIAKYINAIDGIIQCLLKINEKDALECAKKLKKFEDDLNDADAYALKFVSSIVKIKNRKGHRAAITFPCALNEIKNVLRKLSDLGDASLSYASQKFRENCGIMPQR